MDKKKLINFGEKLLVFIGESAHVILIVLYWVCAIACKIVVGFCDCVCKGMRDYYFFK